MWQRNRAKAALAGPEVCLHGAGHVLRETPEAAVDLIAQAKSNRVQVLEHLAVQVGDQWPLGAEQRSGAASQACAESGPDVFA
jgi:hypothetical protein